MTGGDDLDSPPLPGSNRSSLESGRSIGGVANSISPSVMIPERIVTDHRRQSEDMRHREVSFVGHFVFLIFIVSFAISSSSTVPSSLFPFIPPFYFFSLSLSLSLFLSPPFSPSSSLSLFPFSSKVDDDDRDFRRAHYRHESSPSLYSSHLGGGGISGGATDKNKIKKKIEIDPPRRSIRQRLGNREDERRFVIHVCVCVYTCTCTCQSSLPEYFFDDMGY